MTNGAGSAGSSKYQESARPPHSCSVRPGSSAPARSSGPAEVKVRSLSLLAKRRSGIAEVCLSGNCSQPTACGLGIAARLWKGALAVTIPRARLHSRGPSTTPNISFVRSPTVFCDYNCVCEVLLAFCAGTFSHVKKHRPRIDSHMKTHPKK